MWQSSHPPPQPRTGKLLAMMWPNGHTCVWGFGHLADPCKKQADTEINMLVKTRTPRASTNYAQTWPHKYHQWFFCVIWTVVISQYKDSYLFLLRSTMKRFENWKRTQLWWVISPSHLLKCVIIGNMPRIPLPGLYWERTNDVYMQVHVMLLLTMECCN